MKNEAVMNRLFLFAQALLILAALAGTRYAIDRGGQPEKRELVAPPKDIVYFTAGHRDAFADVLWLRSIQDFDYCEKQVDKQLCQKNSWLYQMLDVITDLSPDFRMAYSAGSLALTIIISDIDGASKFLDKAVAHFPNDWLILFKAAYHSIYEEHDNVKGAELLERASQNGAPDWVYALTTRLYTAAGKKEVAEALLNSLEEEGADPIYLQKLRDRMDRGEATEVKLPTLNPDGE